MQREILSDLPKLGSREYVQGGTIFNGILAAADEAFGAAWLAGVRIGSFKLEREAVANGRIIVADAAVAGLEPNATFEASGPNGAVFGYFIDEALTFRREPYDEESFNRPIRLGTDLSGEFGLPAGSRADFIKGVVGANKLLHQKTDRFAAPLTKVQFLYLKSLDALCLQARDEDWRLEISPLTAKETATEAWTIQRVRVVAPSFQSEFRLCYRAQKTA